MQAFDQTQRYELDYASDDKVLVPFFNAVYAWMAVGLAVTAVVAWFVSQVPALQSIFYGGPAFAIFMLLAMFALAWGAQKAALTIGAGAGLALFMLYAALIGGLISYIFIVYETGTLLSAFFITGGMFAGG